MVKRIVMSKRSLIVLAALLVYIGGLWIAGRTLRDSDPNIVVSDQRAPSHLVENGRAYDRAAVDLRGVRQVVLPDRAWVVRATDTAKVELYMEKSLSFAGHPPERMSIRDTRRKMGCLVRMEADTLLIATFAEWDSQIEGGASMRLIAIIPEGMELEHRTKLSGIDGAGGAWQGQWLSTPRNPDEGYWYGPSSPSDGWLAVPDVLDRDHTARRLGG